MSYKLEDIDGNTYETENLKQFCDEYGLTYRLLQYTDPKWVGTGKRSQEWHKNFKILENKDNISIDDNLSKEKMEVSEDIIKAERLFTRKPQTLEEVTQMFEIDTKKWECYKFKVSNWDVTSTKKRVTATNYSVKAEFKKRESLINYDEMIEKFHQDVSKDIPIWNPKNHYSKSGNLLEVNLCDLHIGKLAWGEETGEDFDWKIATKRVKSVIENIIFENKDRDIERIVFIVGNDILHFDTMNKTTSAGTPQDTDIRFQKMFNIACDLMINSIISLEQIAPIDMLYVPSNHDFQTGYYLAMYLSAYFKEHNNITIDTSPKPRKYYEWGKCLIGFSHGDKEKKRISGIMQIEASEAWGRTIYRYWQLAHLHSEHTREENGLIIRNVSSITGTDAWHNTVGYIGATKKTQSFKYNKEDGLIQIQNHIVKSEVK